jgi:general secretion pathway protein A
VLCGDDRLPERFRSAPLASLGTRLRLRLPLEPLHKDHILEYMRHALEQAGGKHLMTESLMETLAEHCCGNLRMLNQMAAELLAVAAEKQLPRIDEGLYLETFSRQPQTRKQARKG